MPAADGDCEFGIGKSVLRKEDAGFLTGASEFLDDVKLDNPAHGIVLRSPHAHAVILKIDTDAAAKSPGVLAVYTGADLRAEHIGSIPERSPLKNHDGSDIVRPHRYALVEDRVRFVGDAVAFIVAETPDAAKDGAALVTVDYDVRPSVTDGEAAVQAGAPTVWEDAPNNVCADYEAGDADKVEAAFAAAAHVVSLDVINNRVTAAPIEPRSAIGIFDRENDHLTLIASSQNVHANRNQIARDIFHVPTENVRVIAPDVGGGFGMRNGLFPEYLLVLFAARRLGRPVKWLCERSEGMITDAHARDHHSHVELAVAADGAFLGLRVSTIGNIGSSAGSMGPPIPTAGMARMQGGPYRIPAVYFHSRAVFTHTVPVEPYRGAGQPEAALLIERAVNQAAAILGIDSLQLRRQNLIRPEDMPYTNGTGITIDSGDFTAVLDDALRLADHDGFAERQKTARQAGLRRGLGICPYVRTTGGANDEFGALRFDPDGAVTVAVGSQSTGMGHQTAFSQIVNDRLGVPFEDVHHVDSDSDLVPLGRGHGGSRSLETAGAAISIGMDKVIDKGMDIASHMLEAAAEDIHFENGRFTIIGTDRAVTMTEVIQASFDAERLPPGMEPGLNQEEHYVREKMTHPNGCHIAEIEVDPETGLVRLVGYTIVNDFGVVINPMLAEGQSIGGATQGIGQAMLEHIVFDEDTGQMLSGSFMDYCLPRASHLPAFRIKLHTGTPTERNPLGVKGAGEDGCTGAPPAIVHAVLDALRDFGVEHLDIPLTPETVWRAIHTDKGAPKIAASTISTRP